MSISQLQQCYKFEQYFKKNNECTCATVCCMIYRWMAGWIGTDGWIDGWMDGWMDGWIDIFVKITVQK